MVPGGAGGPVDGTGYASVPGWWYGNYGELQPCATMGNTGEFWCAWEWEGPLGPHA